MTKFATVLILFGCYRLLQPKTLNSMIRMVWHAAKLSTSGLGFINLKNVKEPFTHVIVERWLRTMQFKMESMHKNKTGDLVSLCVFRYFDIQSMRHVNRFSSKCNDDIFSFIVMRRNFFQDSNWRIVQVHDERNLVQALEKIVWSKIDTREVVGEIWLYITNLGYHHSSLISQWHAHCRREQSSARAQVGTSWVNPWDAGTSWGLR
jgi:hypothetical protein